MEKIWHRNYQQGVPYELDEYEYDSIPDILTKSAENYSDLPAFHNMGKTISYKALETESHRFASFLQNQLQLKPGDRVALMLPNILQYPITLFGILKAGLIAVNVNPMYTARELEHQLTDSGAKAIVIFANAAHLLEKILDRTDVEHVICTEIGDFLKFPKRAKGRGRAITREYLT